MDQEHAIRWSETIGTWETVYHEFDSPIVGDRLAITVTGPVARDAGACPTLYVLDAEPLLGTVSGAARTLEMYSSGHFPSVTVVGIGYRSLDHDDIVARRMRDLTPTETPFPPKVSKPAKYGRGKAEALLRSLREEIIPGIEQRYHVHPTDRTVVGWSYAGLFGLYTLLHQPDTFTRYLLISPSIWYGGGVAFQYEEAWAAKHSDLAAKVFMAVGEREEMPGRFWPPEMMSDDLCRLARMVTNQQEMASRLAGRSYPSLALESVVFPDEHHPTVIPAAVSRGLLSLFVADGWR